MTTASATQAASFDANCRFTRRLVTVGDQSIHQCPDCNHAVTLPKVDDVASLYAERDTQDYQSRDGGLAKLIKTVAFDRQARGIVRGVRGTVRTAYDYGIGSGLLTSAIARALPGAAVTGLDFFDEAPRDLTGAAYRSFSQVEAEAEPADLVTAFHVLEHDDEPARLLGRLTRLCRPGGTLVIEVPNVDAVGASVFGEHWDNWYLPYHRVHFSAESLRRLLEGAGLTVTTLQGVGVPSVGRSLARMAGRPNGLGFVLTSAAMHPVQRAAEIVTDRPTALRAYAVMPDRA